MAASFDLKCMFGIAHSMLSRHTLRLARIETLFAQQLRFRTQCYAMKTAQPSCRTGSGRLVRQHHILIRWAATWQNRSQNISRSWMNLLGQTAIATKDKQFFSSFPPVAENKNVNNCNCDNSDMVKLGFIAGSLKTYSIQCITAASCIVHVNFYWTIIATRKECH